MKNDQLISVKSASRILDCSPDNVRRLERIGSLPAIRLDDGTRAFFRQQVEKLAAERAERKAERSGK